MFFLRQRKGSLREGRCRNPAVVNVVKPRVKEKAVECVRGCEMQRGAVMFVQIWAPMADCMCVCGGGGGAASSPLSGGKVSHFLSEMSCG